MNRETPPGQVSRTCPWCFIAGREFFRLKSFRRPQNYPLAVEKWSEFAFRSQPFPGLCGAPFHFREAIWKKD
jgi:hypothetical protein